MMKMGPMSGKFMAISTVILTLAILMGLARYYSDDIFQYYQDPKHPFQTYKKPLAPDYVQTDSWLAIPDLSADPYEDKTLGDVFVITPTLYRGGEHWLVDVSAEHPREKLQRIARPNYVEPYGMAGRLFAPYYRQSSVYTFMTSREDAKRAQNFAYQDVKRAFRVFLKHSPPERPIILAGHGQGASHLQRILVDFFSQSKSDPRATELKSRLAAAYIIDHPLPLDIFDTLLTDMSPCETEDDTQCIVAFGAFMPDDDVIAKRYVDRALVHDGRGYSSVEGRPLLCMNPLLWNRSSDYAPNRLHKGGIAAEGLDPETLAAPLAKQTGAQCLSGILHVDKPESRALRRRFKFGSKFRTLRSNLFYEDLRVNAAKRVNALYGSGDLPKRAALLDDVSVIDIKDSPITPVQ